MDTSEANTRLRQAAFLFREGRFAESLAVLDRIYQAFPDNKKLLYNKAVCLGKLGRAGEALDCCRSLKGYMPEESLEQLRCAVRAGATPPSSKAAPPPATRPGQDHTVAPGSGFGAWTPPPADTLFDLKKASGGLDLRPMSVFDYDEDRPRFVERGFLEADAVSGAAAGSILLSETKQLTEDGWRCFVALVERLFERLGCKHWYTPPDIPEKTLKKTLALYEKVFVAGELVVALREAKTPLFFSDRRLYFMRAAEESLPSGVTWGLIEAVTQLPSGKERVMEVRRRDGQRIPIDLTGMEDIAAPFAEFLNEASFLYEPQDSAMVLFPLGAKAFEIPEVCCSCLSIRLTPTGGWTVKDPGAPMVLADGYEEENERKGASGSISTAFRALRRRRSGWDEPVHLYVSSDAGVTFRMCPFCSAELPARVSRVGEKFKVFVFRNRHYAAAFARANGCLTAPLPQS